MRSLLAILLLLVPCCRAEAQIKLQPEYASGQPVVVEVLYPDAPEGAAPTDLVWEVSHEAGYQLAGTKVLVWPKYGLKDYELSLTCSGPLVSADGKYIPGSNRIFKAHTKILGIGAQPGPTPDPQPDPTPVPDGEAPIKEPGFRALVVYETADLSKLPPAQQEILYSTASGGVRDYLTKHCVKNANGTPEWKMIDPNVVVAPDSEMWAKVLTRPRQSVPWLIVSNGKQGFEGPLPANAADTLKILAQYVEAK